MTDSPDHGYDLIESMPRLDLPGQVVICDTVERLVEQMSSDLLAHSLNCCRSFGDFHMALSSGTTPIPFYRHLMTDPICRGIPWKRTHLWVVDERRVALDSDESTWSLLHDHFGVHSGIPRARQHPMDALHKRVERRYATELRSALAWREKGQDRLDYVLLGLGTDGTAAGLFPGSPAVNECHEFVRINSGPTVSGPDRVTMTLPLINGSRLIAIMITGSSKRPLVKRLTSGRVSAQQLPVLGVRPIGGTVIWYIDLEACP